MSKFRQLESYRRQRGYELIAGIDEVGRGALAGPLVAAALILKPYSKLPGLKDSKSLTARQRQRFFEHIIPNAIAYCFGSVSPTEIDRLGISRANDLAFERALAGLNPKPHYVLADYFSLESYRAPVDGIKGGDKDVRVIAAASVIAKVYRDNIMIGLDKKFPNYGFVDHVGYGTLAHRQAIKKFGYSPWHRKSFTVSLV